MPRIDPMELLDCLDVLLTDKGGIRCEGEVERFVSLMERFSKKLVSKSVYVLILQATEPHLLSLFMEHGGWNLIHSWVTYSIENRLWELIEEILHLIKICPIDIERLKSNSLPRHIKYLSKAISVVPNDVMDLASQIVQDWLVIVKAATQLESEQDHPSATTTSTAEGTTSQMTKLETKRALTGSSSAVGVGISKDSKSQKLLESPRATKRVIKKAGEDSSMAVKRVLLNTTAKERRSKRMDLDSKSTKIKRGTVVSAKKHTLDESTDEGDDVEDMDYAPAPLSKKPTRFQKERPPTLTTRSSLSCLKKRNAENTGVEVSMDERGKLRVVPSSKNKIVKGKPEVQRGRPLLTSDARKRRAASRSPQKFAKIEAENKNLPSSMFKIGKKSTSKTYPDKKVETAKIEKMPASHPGIPSVEKKDVEKKETEKMPKIPLLKSSLESKSASSEVSKTVKRLPDIPRKPKSISVETRQTTEVRPKTVKTFHSKFRLTGLEEPIPPPKPVLRKQPSLPVDKKPKEKDIPSELSKKLSKIATPSADDLLLFSPDPISSAPAAGPSTAALKSTGIEDEEDDRPGYAKVVSPKYKLNFLQESGLFADALAGMQRDQTHQRKRKKPKEDIVPEETKTKAKPVSDVDQFIHSKPTFRFYKDINEIDPVPLDDSDSRKKSDKPAAVDLAVNEELPEKSSAESPEKLDDKPEEIDHDVNEESNSPMLDDKQESSRGILKYIPGSRRGPKRSVCWRNDEELEAIRYFEKDESERKVCYKNFGDMQMLEKSNEREAILKSRLKSGMENVKEYCKWGPLIKIILEPPSAIPGCNSTEKTTQALREKNIAEVIYFDHDMIPDSPAEPDPEIIVPTVPDIIPFDDVTGNEDAVMDFSDTKWPEPKSEELVPVASVPGFVQNIPQNAFSPFPPSLFPQMQVPPTMAAPPNMATATMPNPIIAPPGMQSTWGNGATVPPQIGPMGARMPPPMMMGSSGYPSNVPYVMPNAAMPFRPPIPSNMFPSNSDNGSSSPGQQWPNPPMADSHQPNIPSTEWNPALEPANRNEKQEGDNSSTWHPAGDYTAYDNRSNNQYKPRGEPHGRGHHAPFRGRFNDRGNYNERDGGDRNYRGRGGSWRGFGMDRGAMRRGRGRGGAGGPDSWRGGTSDVNMKLCRNVNKYGFCKTPKCRFFHPN